MSETKYVSEKYAHLAGKWVDYSTRPWDSPVEGEEEFCDRCIVLIDGIIDEPDDLKRNNVDEVIPGMVSCIESFIKETADTPAAELIAARYERFRRF